MKSDSGLVGEGIGEKGMVFLVLIGRRGNSEGARNEVTEG